jgi:hypothetical protein
VNQHNSTFVFPSSFDFTFLKSTLLILVMLGLAACATTPQSSLQPSQEMTTEGDSQPAATTENTTTAQNESAPEQASDSVSSATSDNTPPAADIVVTPAEPEPVRIVESCKSEPYSQYEEQARASMAKGLEATLAKTYGVGFRNVAEHKKWSDTHGKLFKSVNQACDALSLCAKQHPKDKTTQCAQQAAFFKEWQDMAKRFADNAKLSETTQPPTICSFEPSLEDSADCFNTLADNIDKFCNTAACKEASDCWRGIGFLDYAINQASSACGFAQQPLSECHGYVTATQRRKDKFKRCGNLQNGLNITALPPL